VTGITSAVNMRAVICGSRHSDLQIPTVKEEIRPYRSQYSVRLSTHPNDLTVNLIELSGDWRLRNAK
jgi:hypothetical protein